MTFAGYGTRPYVNESPTAMMRNRPAGFGTTNSSSLNPSAFVQ